MLEPLVDAWEEEPSSDIKMQLLTAAVKLFFKRPPEMQVIFFFFSFTDVFAYCTTLCTRVLHVVLGVLYLEVCHTKYFCFCVIKILVIVWFLSIFIIQVSFMNELEGWNRILIFLLYDKCFCCNAEIAIRVGGVGLE